MGRLRALACGTSLAIAGCSVLTSLDGLSSGGAATPVDAGGSTDSQADAPGVAETSTKESGATKGFCESQSPAPTLCEDFDFGDPGSRWDLVVKSGTASRVDTPVRSSPHAYAFAVPPGSQARWAFLQKSRTELVTHARLAYSLWVEQRPTGEFEVSLLRFHEPNGGANHDYYLAVTANGALFVEQRDTPSGNIELPFSGVVPTKTWTRVSIEVFLSPPARVIVKVNDVEVTNVGSALGAPGIPDVNVGITYSGSNQGSGSIFLDDVTFEILP